MHMLVRAFSALARVVVVVVVAVVALVVTVAVVAAATVEGAPCCRKLVLQEASKCKTTWDGSIRIRLYIYSSE